MEYDIIEKLVELAYANPADELPGAAARLLREAFSFDYCGFYAWDDDTGLFTLQACSGDETNSVRVYPGDTGVPGMVRRKMAPVEAFDLTRQEAGCDRGLAGFTGAVAYPLIDRAALWGVLYLKVKHATALTQKRRSELDAAVKLFTVGLRCADLRSRWLRARSDVVEMQARLANSEKLLALVDMAATLAHEIRSPLISIGGFTARLKKKIGPGEPARRYVSLIEAETARLEKLINGMIRFLREAPIEFTLGDMNEIMEDALGFFSEDFLSHGITVVRQMHRGPLWVLADREQLKIAFDNLIANAIQSMDSGGTLVLRTGRSGGNVVVTLSDSGGGIDPENMKNIFNPFFTTKSCGTGLGLPITNSIITRHNGFIAVDNNVGVGVSFSIHLPEAGEELAGQGVEHKA